MLRIVRANKGSCKVCYKRLSIKRKERLGYQIQYRKRRFEAPELSYGERVTHRINLCDKHFIQLSNAMKKTIERKKDV